MTIVQLSLFRLRDFRCLASSMGLNAVGTMGEVVVLGWLALELTSSPFLVGLALGMRALPLFFVGAPAGVLADRFARHRLLMLTGAGQALTAAVLGALTLTGRLRFTHLLLLTLVAGIIRGVEWAARQSYTHDVVGPTELINALALLGVAMRSGWLLGSLGAGMLIAHFGSGLAYLAVALGYLAGAAPLIWASAPTGIRRAAAGSLWQGVVGFITAMRTDRILPVLMLLTAGAEVLGFSHQALLPSLARDILRVGPEGLGTMNAARAVGGILGLFAVGARGPVRGGGTLFLVVLLAFGASLVTLGAAPRVVGYAGVVIVLVAVNALGAVSDLLSQSLMQLSVPERLRGRVGGAWVVAIGLAPVGQLQIGALASLFGVGIALGASGLALTALAGAAALTFPRVRRI
jgi:MFS family permease